MNEDKKQVIVDVWGSLSPSKKIKFYIKDIEKDGRKYVAIGYMFNYDGEPMGAETYIESESLVVDVGEMLMRQLKETLIALSVKKLT